VQKRRGRRRSGVASAAVPGVFPPVIIDVEAGGQHYQEMHVDGGAVAQTFLDPPQIGTTLCAYAPARGKVSARRFLGTFEVPGR